MYDVSNKFKEHVKNNGYIEKSARKAVDEVARIKWSDFVLEPSKPNLIENGWDDFEPYGGAEVKITPLGNGLTRIQTWGGNAPRKFYHRTLQNMSLNKTHTISLYLENLGDDFEIRGISSHYTHIINIEKGFKAFVNVQQTPEMRSYVLGFLTDSNLDFIASDPVIVEGDKANPVLIVTPLEDGRSHVRVFGATPETKLVHKATKGFAGEPYTLSTEIENEGLQLQMDTNLSEQSETIRKGDNQVNIEGNLEGNNIEIKLGTE